MLPIFTKVKPRTHKKTKRRLQYQVDKHFDRIKLYKDMTDEEKSAYSKYQSDHKMHRLQNDIGNARENHRNDMRKYMEGYNQRLRGEHKTCNTCKILLPYCKFDLREPKRSRTKHQWYSHYETPPKETLRPYCKKCRSLYNKEYYAKRKLRYVERVETE